MSNIIYPLIFFSISEDGKEMTEAVQKFSSKINQPVYSKFVRYIFFNENNTITTSINDDILTISFNSIEPDKQNSYAEINKIRKNYLSVFESVIGDIKNIDNRNYALENDFEIGKTQIIILSSIDYSNLSPLILPLVLGIDTFKNELRFQLLLLYNQDLTSNKNRDSRILKNAFLKEIETIGNVIKPEIWLLDIINEEGINLKDKANLHRIVSQFFDLIISDAESIDRVVYNDGKKEKGRFCMYSSIGYSVLSFPIEKAKEYMVLFAYGHEFNNLAEKFNLNFESILLKDELTKFLKKNRFNELSNNLTKKDNSDLIYEPFTFNKNELGREKEEVLLKQLSAVNSPLTLSNTITSGLFQKIDAAEKTHIDNVLIEFSGHLNAAKNREFSNFIQLIEKAQCDFIDNKEKGINYSILFTAILSNNKAVVESMLDGRFTYDIPTLVSLEDICRGKFIGDEISIIEKKLRDESDNSINKLELKEEYLAKLNDDEISFEKINTSLNSDNPKLAELTASIKNFKDEILTLSVEIETHNKIIIRLKSKIEKIKSEFDRDATKEKYKVKRNADLLKEIEYTRTTEIVDIDEKLSKKHEEKNIRIKERKKFIFINLIVIPLILLFVMFSLQFVLYYNFDWFNTEIFKKVALIAVLIELIYYAINFTRFNNLIKEFKNLIGEISDLLRKKKNSFQKYINNKNQCFKNDFSFEIDLISLSMMKSLKEYTSKLQNKAELFKKQISEESKKYLKLTNAYSFIENSFELCTIEKDDIEAIYKNNITGSLFGNTSKNSLSSCYRDFNKTNQFIWLKQLIDKGINDVFKRKVEIESLKSILFNESKSFGKVNTKAKFNILIETSKPLLQTSNSYFPNIAPDIPYTENILIGSKDNAFDDFFNNYNLEFNDSIKIEENNKNILGILSIKSNFPSFIIYDVKDNEDLIRKEVNLNNKFEYFVNDTAFDHQLMPSSSYVETDDRGNLLMGEELIVALSKKLIEFDIENGKYFHPIVGELGFKLEDLIDYWNKPICYDIRKKAIKIDDELWDLDEDERNDYLNEFKNFWLLNKAIVSKKHENELSEYFFTRNGKVEDWNEIKAIFKENRRNSRTK